MFQGFDLKSNNNCWGWLCYFAAHLYRNCGIEAGKVEEAVVLESDRAKYKVGFQSDNQCIMSGNGWFYSFNKIDESWTCDAEPGVILVPEMFQEGFEHWVGLEAKADRKNAEIDRWGSESVTTRISQSDLTPEERGYGPEDWEYWQ